MSLISITIGNLSGQIPALPIGTTRVCNSDVYRPVKKAAVAVIHHPKRTNFDHMIDQRMDNESRVLTAIANGTVVQVKIAEKLKLSQSAVSIICSALEKAGRIRKTRIVRPYLWEVI